MPDAIGLITYVPLLSTAWHGVTSKGQGVQAGEEFVWSGVLGACGDTREFLIP